MFGTNDSVTHTRLYADWNACGATARESCTCRKMKCSQAPCDTSTSVPASPAWGLNFNKLGRASHPKLAAGGTFEAK